MQAPRPPVESEAHDALQVGEWRVDPPLNQIVRGADIVHLEPKAMAVLLHLAERPGDVVSRDALLAAVWPGVIVGDNALTQVVTKLRRALGDTAREPAYIQAIAKKGYRLIAPVVREPAEPVATPPVATTPYASRVRRLPRRVARSWPGLLLAILLVGAAALWLRGSGEQEDASLEPAPRPDASTAAAQPTVLVRPLQTANSDPQQALFAQAITADLVIDLSKISGIWVASGGSAEQRVRDAVAMPPPRYALSGSVQRDGERLRLYLSLLDVPSGRQLWSERFDREAADLFAMQDDLVQSIVAVLPVKLNEAERRRLAQRYTRNLEAYEHFVRGQSALLVRRRAQNDLARESYWKAIHADPTFARAYAGLAMTFGLEYQLGWAPDGEAALRRGLEFAETSVQMDPEMPEAHWVVGFVHLQALRHDEALRHVQRALKLNPSYADAYALQAGIHILSGRPAEAIAPMRTALRLNPDAGSLYFMQIGRAYYFLGDAEQARVNLEHALQRNPESLESRIYLAATLLLAGDRASAVWQAQEILALEPHFSAQTWLATYPMTDPGQKDRLVRALREIGL